jgi:cell division protein YceG involved in septum cleavage
MDALEAALWPNDTTYYFFQHDNRGRIYLRRTAEEHERVRADLVIQGINQ